MSASSGSASSPRRGRRDCLQVGAGAEVAAGAGEHGDPCLGVGVEARKTSARRREVGPSTALRTCGRLMRDGPDRTGVRAIEYLVFISRHRSVPLSRRGVATTDRAAPVDALGFPRSRASGRLRYKPPARGRAGGSRIARRLPASQSKVQRQRQRLAACPDHHQRHRAGLHLRPDRARLRADLQGHRDGQLRAGRPDDGRRLHRPGLHDLSRLSVLARGAGGHRGHGAARLRAPSAS